ncbi:MAG TPA: DUF1134 domain-containing protein [Solimonas sp.]|nr:DUF1134 domain-containing protein [Solimonas sp.]
MRVLLAAAVCLGLAACNMEPIQSDPSGQEPPRSVIVQPDAKPGAPADVPVGDSDYTSEEIVKAASQALGQTSESMALAVERIFSRYGRPKAYIIGQEGGGAAVVGVRYGKGVLAYKGGGSMTVFWQGPSIGWDFGGNASKVFTLVYNLRNTYELFQRFPAVEGSLYVVAGVSVNYQQSGDIVLAPMRSGVGLRAGANLGYVHYTREASAIPF